MSGLAPNTLGRLGHPFFDGSKHQARVSEVSEMIDYFLMTIDYCSLSWHLKPIYLFPTFLASRGKNGILLHTEHL